METDVELAVAAFVAFIRGALSGTLTPGTRLVAVTASQRQLLALWVEVFDARISHSEAKDKFPTDMMLLEHDLAALRDLFGSEGEGD
jgi:hypothetical protein